MSRARPSLVFNSFDLELVQNLSYLECPRVLMNDLPEIGYPCYAQRTLGSPGGKHCKSLEGNVWRKAVSTSKKRNFGERSTFFPEVLSQMDFGNVEMRKM